MMKLDPTLKHIGLVLRRRLANAPDEMPPRIAELMERLSHIGRSNSHNDDPNPMSSPE
jgi:hypothetical protein